MEATYRIKPGNMVVKTPKIA